MTLSDGARRYVYGKSKTEALAKVRDALSADATGTVAIEDNATVGQLLTDWLNAKRTDGKTRPTTLASYEDMANRVLKPLHRVRAKSLTPAHVRKWRADYMATTTHRGQAPSNRTVAYAQTVLAMALGLAVKDGRLRKNAAKDTDRIDVEHKAPERVLTGDELNRLVVSTDHPTYRALWAVLGGTGLRLGEALGLKWSDIDTAAGVLSVNRSLRVVPNDNGAERLQILAPKTAASRRRVRIPKFAMQALAGVPRQLHSDYVFTTGKATFLNPSNTRTRFKADLATAGLPDMRIHDLRHTAAVLMLLSGTDLMSVSQTLGHTQLATTSIYLQALPRGRQDIADRMDTMVGAVNF
ncbi:MAG: tyrosine-type recombinase/integrase [Candidatus Limnocylindrales bacterium]